jgi:cation transport regulator ChaB
MAKVLRRSAQQFIQQVIESEIEPYMDQVNRTSEERLDVDNDYLPTKTGQN